MSYTERASRTAILLQLSTRDITFLEEVFLKNTTASVQDVLQMMVRNLPEGNIVSIALLIIRSLRLQEDGNIVNRARISILDIVTICTNTKLVNKLISINQDPHDHLAYFIDKYSFRHNYTILDQAEYIKATKEYKKRLAKGDTIKKAKTIRAEETVRALKKFDLTPIYGGPHSRIVEVFAKETILRDMVVTGSQPLSNEYIV